MMLATNFIKNEACNKEKKWMHETLRGETWHLTQTKGTPLLGVSLCPRLSRG